MPKTFFFREIYSSGPCIVNTCSVLIDLDNLPFNADLFREYGQDKAYLSGSGIFLLYNDVVSGTAIRSVDVLTCASS